MTPQNSSYSILLLGILVCDVEVPQLVHIPVLVGCNHSEPVPHIVLLQVLLGQVLQVPLGEGALGGDADLVLLTSDGDGGAEHARFAVNLDAVVEELFEGGDVHDLVLHGLATVDGERLSLLLALGHCGRLLGHGGRHGEAAVASKGGTPRAED